jgi:hypothetical protein
MTDAMFNRQDEKTQFLRFTFCGCFVVGIKVCLRYQQVMSLKVEVVLRDGFFLLLLFLLKEKVTKKFKDGAIAPRARPCRRTGQESLPYSRTLR